MSGGPRLHVVAPLAGVGALLVAFVIVWSVDAARARTRVARNVTVAGLDVGGMTPTDLQAQVADLAARFAATAVQVNAVAPGDGSAAEFATTAGEVGLVVDQARTIALVLEANRGGSSPVAWLDSFTDQADVTPVVELIEAKARITAATFDESARTRAVEPKIELRDGALVALAGSSGVGLDAESVVEALQPVRYTRSPISVRIELEQIAPARDLAAISAYVDQVNALTADPLTVKAGGASVELTSDTLRRWVKITDDGTLELTFDEALANLQITETLAGAGTTPVDATIALVGEPRQPVIEGGIDGTTCCTPEAAATVLEAVKRRAEGPTPGPVELPLVVQPPAITRQAIEALGIVEPVASFRTEHPCCAARVQNIHRMADLVQGYVIKPGEMLSINTLVGKRTLDKGFVAAPAIVDGDFGEEVGGGISQYMTTLFNAAWFAGLDFGEYQSHSLPISRYPYGREATVNYPSPDFQVVNNLPYAVLIENSYDDTSITVTIWSSPVFATVEPGRQETFRSGTSCTGIRTYRIRTYLDGQVEEDYTRARYRDTAGINCDGQPARPEG